LFAGLGIPGSIPKFFKFIEAAATLGDTLKMVEIPLPALLFAFASSPKRLSKSVESRLSFLDRCGCSPGADLCDIVCFISQIQKIGGTGKSMIIQQWHRADFNSFSLEKLPLRADIIFQYTVLNIYTYTLSCC
jgi:hypothetical protein